MILFGRFKEILRKKMSWDAVLLAPGISWIAIFLIAPLAVLTFISFMKPTRGGGYVFGFTLENYIDIFTSPIYADIFIFSIRWSLQITAILLVLGFTLAYALAMAIKSERYRYIAFLLMLVPFWIDWSVRTIAWFPILGENGVLNYALMALGIIKEPSRAFILSGPALLIVWIQTYVLFMASPIFFALAKLDPRILKAAASLGASRFRVFYHITLRMSLPGIVIGCIFIFTMTLADYATPGLIGGGIQTISLNVVDLLSFLRWPRAAALSTIIMSIAFVFIYIMLRIVNVRRMLF